MSLIFYSRYVEQDDHLYAHVTVKETVAFNALLRLPEDKSRGEKLAQVDRILSIFGLKDVQNSLIGNAEKRGISGGERKRVSICNELVADPRLIFMDEPTSGLDSFTALTICEALKEYVERGRETILMTIHQPRLNLLRLFNAIIILSQGKVVFFGSVDDAVDHFTSLGHHCPEGENPADYFLDLATVSNKSPEEHETSQIRVNSLVNAWHYDPIIVPISQHERQSKHTYPVSPLEQFYLLLQRNFIIIVRDYENLIGELVTTLVIALLLSFIFFQLSSNFGGVQGRIGLLFFITVNIVFSIITPLLPIFVLDRAIMKKERYASTYRLSMAYLARFISLLPSRIFLYTLFAFIVYYITGLRT